ncbi:hypothetical protein CY35_01G081500 [Sphagnum magellanicum]|nr:hypothetical protein CY35_01G081500 [Sphagnum magellanicum]
MDLSGGATTSTTNGVDSSEVLKLKRDHAQQREGLVLTKRPMATVKLFSLSVLQQLRRLSAYVIVHQHMVSAFCVFLLINITTLAILDGPHEKYVREVLAYLRFGIWWVGLGVASSIGLGSGLHTFVLYLGPHIALFTIRATQCGRVDLKCAPYDTPQFGLASSWQTKDCSLIGPPMYPRLVADGLDLYMVPLHKVLLQVQLEAVLWGLGTTLGELPPYFVSRAARLSGQRVKEFDDLMNPEESGSTGLFDFLKRWTILRFHKFGFFTILLFASVPNPLFDLAGIMCGQFLVPFWKFFLASLIGKALIKTHIQTVFIILACNAHLLEVIEAGLEWAILHVPAFAHLSPRIMSALGNAKDSFNGKVDAKPVHGSFSIAFVWNTVVLLMMAGFLASIITSMAQGFLMERQKQEMAALMELLSNNETKRCQDPKDF